MKKILLSTTISLNVLLQACAQDSTRAINPGNYIIDESVKKPIKKKELDGQASLDIQWLENGKEGMQGVLSGKEMPCFAIYSTDNDTVKIILLQMLVPAGIQIKLYKGSSWLFHFVSSKDKSLRSFKTNADDKEYQYSPHAPARSFKLILSQEPKIGEPIEGYVQFESVDFYQQGSTGDLKRNYNAKGYFKATNM